VGTHVHGHTCAAGGEVICRQLRLDGRTQLCHQRSQNIVASLHCRLHDCVVERADAPMSETRTLLQELLCARPVNRTSGELRLALRLGFVLGRAVLLNAHNTQVQVLQE
jgi:hypothetical protein